jgi:hypothetical protein
MCRQPPQSHTIPGSSAMPSMTSQLFTTWRDQRCRLPTPLRGPGGSWVRVLSLMSRAARGGTTSSNGGPPSSLPTSTTVSSGFPRVVRWRHYCSLWYGSFGEIWRQSTQNRQLNHPERVPNFEPTKAQDFKFGIFCSGQPFLVSWFLRIIILNSGFASHTSPHAEIYGIPDMPTLHSEITLS